ncbi:accessory gene regulator ArgB-like protein [Clostridium thailandense]|uniref:accessory gene regulator ArgB-like protein n=1 Tax=Clostridium thailandense TaxID=2794346 RepID=UPI0039898302
MFLIEKISNKIGNKIALNLDLDKDNEEIIAYGAFNLLQAIFCIFWVVILGIILKVLVQALIISFSWALLRKYSGGAHASTPNRCAGIGAVETSALALIVNEVFPLFSIEIIGFILVLCMVSSYYIINKLAPVDSEAKPIVKLETRKRLKRNSIRVLNLFAIIIIILGIIYFRSGSKFFLNTIEALLLGVMWQASTLTAKGHQLLYKIEDVLNILQRRKKDER